MRKLMPLLLSGAIFLSACNKAELEKSVQDAENKITNSLNQFKDLKDPAPGYFSYQTPKVKGKMSALSGDNNTGGCISVLHTQSATFDKLNVIDPTSDIMYPGSLLDGRSISTGAYTPVIFSDDYTRKPITFSVSTAGLNNIAIQKTITPDLASYRTAMQEVINTPAVGEQPSGFTFNVRRVRSKQEMIMKAGATLDIGKFFTSKVDFNENTENSKNYYLLQIQQKFFTVDLNIPTDGNLFNKPFNFDSDIAPAYISSIDYGRSAYLLIESSYDSSRVEAALKVTFDFWKASGGGNISKETKEVTDEMTMSGTTIGGSSSLAAQTISGLQGFHDFVVKSGNLTQDSRGAIISYRLRSAKTHSVYSTQINGDYYKRDCSGAKRLLYNFYSKQFGHIYTINPNFAAERSGWIRIVNDPIYVYGTQIPGTVPVYIMQHRARAIYCLTTDPTIDLDVWASTGQPEFYAYKFPTNQTVGIHQFYNPRYPTHGYFYDITLNPLSNGWVENTVKFYAFNTAN